MKPSLRVLALGFTVAGCAVLRPSTTPRSAISHGTRPELARAIDSMISDREFRTTNWGILIVDPVANQRPLSPQAEHGWWYQYYFATQRGVDGYRENTHDFNKLIWQEASPLWKFDDATYDRTATAFTNPDHVDVVIHNYRWRLQLAPGEPQYDELDRTLATSPPISVPTITIGSDFDGPAKDGASYRAKFTGPYAHRVLDGIGHNVPQEAPRQFADAVIAVDQL